MISTCINCEKTVGADDSVVFFSSEGKIYFACGTSCKETWLSGDSSSDKNSSKTQPHST